MHYYSFNPSAYTLDTVHLDNDHDLAYRRLIDLYYTSEAPIPKETQLVAIRLRCGSDVVLDVLKEFFIETEKGWLQARCDAEISIYHRKAEVARANGKAGGRPKKTKRVKLANRIGTGLQPDGKLTNNQELVTNNQVKKDATHPEFGEFWNSYPNKNGKAEALKSWIKNKPNLAQVLESLQWQKRSESWTKDGGQYVPHASTYLNQRRFEDPKPIRVVQSVTGGSRTGGHVSCL